MKKTFIFAVAAAVLTLVGCARQYDEETVRGVLYTDSTLTTPITNAELYFWELYFDEYPTYSTEGRYLGYARTSREGKWGFSYITDFDNPYMTERKFSRVYPRLAIEYNGKLIYVDDHNASSPIRLYPGCWKNPYDIDTVSSSADTTASKGGAR